MKPIRIGFEARECRTTQAKVIRDKVRVMLGDSEEVFHKDGVEDAVRGYVLRHLRRPEVRIVKAGDEVRVIISHGGYTETYRPDREGDGCVGACHTSSSGESVDEAAMSVALHLAQITATNYKDTPAWLPSSRVNDYQRWCMYQRQHLAKQVAEELV